MYKPPKVKYLQTLVVRILPEYQQGPGLPEQVYLTSKGNSLRGFLDENYYNTLPNWEEMVSVLLRSFFLKHGYPSGFVQKGASI